MNYVPSVESQGNGELAHENRSAVPTPELPFPKQPVGLEELDVDFSVVSDLALRLACTVPFFTTQWAADQLKLQLQTVEKIFWQHKEDHLIEVMGQESPFNYKYALTKRGREHAKYLYEACGYIGAAPVSLETYTDMMSQQVKHLPQVRLDDIKESLKSLVLPRETVEIAALAAASGRSLFLFGPAGNGKTSLGRLLHEAQSAEVWVPYAISVGQGIVRVFDPQVHKRSTEESSPKGCDRRWVRVQRPMIVAGGEMKLEELDLTFNEAQRVHEAPLQLKANGGTFLIDDFGRQQCQPEDILNRWIVPLENRVDYLNMVTGQKFMVPFEVMLVVATNLQVSEVADPAFLRRMGYRIHLQTPDESTYRDIFKRLSVQNGISISESTLDSILGRYRSEKRELRGSEPRDLIQRCFDICNLREIPLEINSNVLDLAWQAYFGNDAS